MRLIKYAVTKIITKIFPRFLQIGFQCSMQRTPELVLQYRRLSAPTIKKSTIISTNRISGHFLPIKKALLIVLLIFWAADCLAFQSEKDRDCMKDTKPFHDCKVSTNKRSSPEENSTGKEQSPGVTDTACPQKQSKRVRAASLPNNNVVKTLKRQRCVKHCTPCENTTF